MPRKLPKGWVKTTLGEIAEPSRTRALPTKFPDARYVGLEHIESQTMKLLGHVFGRDVRSSSAIFSKGDVLYGKMRPYLNKVWVAEFDGLCSTEFLVLPKRDMLDSHFLAFRLNAEDFVAFANARVSGERPRVNFKKLSPFSIHLPPTAEQKRIVAKLNSALTRISKGENAANRALQKLKDHRANILQAAVIGELTRRWRKAQLKKKKAAAEAGEAVLQRLLEIRRARWEEATLQRLRASSKAPKDDKWKSRYLVPPKPDTSDFPELPKKWAWASLDMIAEIGSGISVSQNKVVNNPVELPYLRVANVLRGQLDLTEVKTIRVEKERLSDYLLESGDILFTEGGDRDKLGRGWIWEGQISKCVHQNHVFRARLFDQSLVDPRFVSYWGNTFGQQYFFKHGKQTTNLASINRTILCKLPVPIPPSSEQCEIMREVERHFASADRLAATLNRQIERAGSTRQALFREAFAGNLVPQRKGDEPASVLLERIRKEKAARKTEQKKSRQRLRSTKIERGDSMEREAPSRESIRDAWERIGRKTDARLLFDEAGYGPDHVDQFYETLRVSPEIRAAFEKASQADRHPQKPTKQYKEKQSKSEGRFRLIELWIEDFKNLKDYTVRFDTTHALDVLLGWNGTGKSNLFEALVIIFRDLNDWLQRNRWPEKPMAGYRLTYEIERYMVKVTWRPESMKRPELRRGPLARKAGGKSKLEPIKRKQLPLPRFVFGYYSGPTNRLAEHFLPMKQDHYVRLRQAKSDDAETLAELLEQRRFFCAETHHAKYVLLAFSYKEDQEISEFLKNRLRILSFESALFIIRKPRWAKTRSKAENFWGATGIMRRVMERLRNYAIAPMVLEQTVSYGYRSTKEDHYYFYLPDIKSLHSFAAEYQDARTFFLALESTDFSELIHDVQIQVRIEATNTESVPITFHELSEGEQQLLMVLGLMRFTKSHQSLVLLDEPDTHLNPHWSVNYLKDLTRVMSDNALESAEQQSSHILMATHDPLVIPSLVKEQIYLLKRDPQTGGCRWVRASINPRGLGFTGILTSEMFGFRSDLDEETLADLDNKVRLMAKEGDLNTAEKKELELINKRLAETGFQKAFSDPYYAAFVRAWGQKYGDLMAGQQFLSEAEREEIDRVAREVLDEARAEVDKKVSG